MLKLIGKYIYMVILLSIIGCNGDNSLFGTKDIYFPKDTHSILQINNTEDFLKMSVENTFWKYYKANMPGKNTKEVIKTLKNNPFWIVYTKEDTHFIYNMGNDTSNIWKKGKKNNVDSLYLKNIKWYYTKNNDKLFISTTKNIDTLFTPKNKTSYIPINKFKNVINEEYTANMFLNKDKTASFFNMMFPSKITKYFKDWSSWDILLEKDKIQMTGSTFIKNDSTSIGILVDADPIEIQSDKLVPLNIQNVQFYSFSDINELKFKNKIDTEFKRYVNEVFIFSGKSHKKVVGVTSMDIEESFHQLFIIREDDYQGVKIYDLEENEELKLFFLYFGVKINPKKVFLYNSSLIFAENDSALKEIINQIQTNYTLVNYLSYLKLIKSANSKASYSEIVNLNENSTFNKEYSILSNTYGLALLQLTVQKEHLICNFTSIVSPKQEENKETLLEKYKIQFNTELFTTPKWVINHKTNRKELFVQDMENVIYLIGSDGNILWKKKLNHKINSPIYQIDMYKNGNLQLVFSTEKEIHIIDRNGNEVKPFPMVSKEELLPLEIYDYESNLTYRFMMATKNSIKMIDIEGKEVKGFEKFTTSNEILATPKHFRINDRDYLLFPMNNGKLNILHRNGKERLLLKDRFNFSNNEVHLEGNYFSFTTKEGNQVLIDEKAGAKTIKRNLDKSHLLSYRYNTEAIVSENKLFINKKEITLPYGIYQKPKIFKIGKIIYISVTDIQNNKIYLYSSDGILIKNFPIFGASTIEVTIDDGKPLISFLKDRKSIYIYEFRKGK